MSSDQEKGLRVAKLVKFMEVQQELAIQLEMTPREYVMGLKACLECAVEAYNETNAKEKFEIKGGLNES